MKRRKVKTNARSLDVIAADIHKLERANIFEVGKLLLEAQEQLTEDESWMDWVQEEFEYSHQTATNYMAAARLVTRFQTVWNLAIPARTIYELAGDLDDEDLPAIIQALQKAARRRRLKVAEAEELIQRTRLRIAFQPHGMLPEIPGGALDDLEAVPEDERKAVLEKLHNAPKPLTKEVVEKICFGEPPEPDDEPDDEPEPDDDDEEADDDDEADDDAPPPPVPPTPLPSELLDALKVVLDYARRPTPTKVGGITTIQLTEIEEFITELRTTIDGGDLVKRAADRAEASAARRSGLSQA